MREVAFQAANDTNNDQDRANLQAELNATVTEIDRIAVTTTWDGANLMEDKTGTNFLFQVGTATGGKNQININIGGTGADALGLIVDASTGLGIRLISDTAAKAAAIATAEIAAEAAANTAASNIASAGGFQEDNFTLSDSAIAVGV